MPPRFTATEKTCKDCRETKPVGQFYRAGGPTSERRQPRCIPCHNRYTMAWKAAHPDAVREIDRRAALRRLYGVSPEVYTNLLIEQGNGCAICGGQPNGRGDHLAVDHDGERGTVRGLLCTSCNNGLGRFRHDPALLRQAAAYLEAERE